MSKFPTAYLRGQVALQHIEVAGAASAQSASEPCLRGSTSADCDVERTSPHEQMLTTSKVNKTQRDILLPPAHAGISTRPFVMLGEPALIS